MPRPKIGGYAHRSLIADAKRQLSQARDKLKDALYETSPRAQNALLTLVALHIAATYESLAEMQAIIDDPGNRVKNC